MLAQADNTAPTVVSFSYAVTPPAYSETSSVTSIAPGARITLDLTANETVTRASLLLIGPTTLTLNRTGGSGSRVLWSVEFPRVLPAGSYTAAVDLTDTAGNTARRSLTLPAPGFVVTERIDSPCLLPTDDGAGVCTDADGDGSAGNSAVCSFGGDCDDTNPTVKVGAPEIPGDGVDNSCAGRGDTAVDEVAGVFVAPFPSGGAVTPPGTIAPARSAVWYDYSSSCTLFQDDDGGLFFWDATGVRGKQSCGSYSGDLVNPSRTATSIGACWVPIWAKNGNGSRILTPIAGVAPGSANSEVSFSNATNCTANSGSAGNGPCTVSWLPRNTAVTANLGSGGSAWYTGLATVNVRKPAWGTECPRSGSPSDFTWSPPGVGTEDPSCTECNGTRAVWTMNRAATVDQKWQYVDNPHAHPVVMMVHEGDYRGLSQIADANIPDSVSTIASEHWPMYTFVVLGSLTISSSNELVLGAGTKRNGFPSLLVDVNITLAQSARMIAAGNVYGRNNVNGPEKFTSFSERFLGPGDSVIENGTRAHPFRTFRRGVDEARAANKVVFVAHGNYSDGGPGLVMNVPIFGGFVSTGWQRVPFTRSSVTIVNPTSVTNAHMAGIDLDVRTGGSVAVDGGTLIDVGVLGAGMSTFGDTRLVRSEIDGALNVGFTLVDMHSTFNGPVTIDPIAVGLFQRSTFLAPVSAPGGTLKVARSVFSNAPVTGGTSVVRISQSTFLDQGAPAITMAGGVVVLSNNLFAGAATDLAIGATTINLHRFNLFEGTCPVARNGVCDDVCGVQGNVCAPGGLASAGDFHITASSPAVNAGMNFNPEFKFSTSAVDMDGHCIAGGIDIGADER